MTKRDFIDRMLKYAEELAQVEDKFHEFVVLADISILYDLHIKEKINEYRKNEQN